MSFRFVAYWFNYSPDHDGEVFNAFKYNECLLEMDSGISIQFRDKSNVYGSFKDLDYMINNKTFRFKGVDYNVSDVDVFRVDNPIFKQVKSSDVGSSNDGTYQSTLF